MWECQRSLGPLSKAAEPFAPWAALAVVAAAIRILLSDLPQDHTCFPNPGPFSLTDFGFKEDFSPVIAVLCLVLKSVPSCEFHYSQVLTLGKLTFSVSTLLMCLKYDSAFFSFCPMIFNWHVAFRPVTLLSRVLCNIYTFTQK